MRFVRYRNTGFFISKVSHPSRYRKAISGSELSLVHSTVGTSPLGVMLQGRRTVSPAKATIFGTTIAEGFPVDNRDNKTQRN